MPLPTKSALVLIGWLADQDESTLLQVASLRGLKPSECGSLAEMSQALLGEVNTLATLRALPRAAAQPAGAVKESCSPCPRRRSRRVRVMEWREWLTNAVSRLCRVSGSRRYRFWQPRPRRS